VVVFLPKTALMVIARGAEASDVQEAAVILRVAYGRVGTGGGVALAGVVCESGVLVYAGQSE